MPKRNFILIITGSFVILILAILLIVSVLTPTGTLLVKSNQKSSIVNINGKRYVSDTNISLSAGTYQVIVTKDGYDDVSLDQVTVKAGEKTEVQVKMVVKISTAEKNFQTLLPYTGNDFMVYVTLNDDGSYTYTVELLIELPTGNYPGKIEQRDQLSAQYKKEALRWILSQSIDPATIKIEYIPPEAKDL